MASMSRTAAAGLLVILSFLPMLASASRVTLEFEDHEQQTNATSEPGDSDVSQEKLKANEEDCQAAVRKCAGVNGGDLSAVKANVSMNSTGNGDSFVQEEVALAHSLAMNLGGTVTGEDLLSVELSSMRMDDFHCDSEDWAEFRKKFGIAGKSDLGHTSFSSGDICQENNVVWLYPEHDHNGAFAINHNVCHRLMMWSKHACSVSVKRVGTTDEAKEFISRFPADSIMHLVVGGHGNGYSLQWGGKSNGWFGLQKTGGRVPVGAVVKVEHSFRRLNTDRKEVSPGEHGYVGNVDGDGDAMVYFDNVGMSFVSWAEFSSYPGHEPKLSKVDSLMPNDIMSTIGAKMQPHASIFTDSCLSATGKYNPNLAAWVAQTVGKGVRVIGSEVSFGRVDVKRFQGGWHASLNTPEMRHAQRVYVNDDAKCPAWAYSRSPDKDGNCACGYFQTCKTRSGKPCPAAQNKESSSYFLPACGEQWAEDPCLCAGGSGASAAAPSLLLLALGSLLAMLAQS